MEISLTKPEQHSKLQAGIFIQSGLDWYFLANVFDWVEVMQLSCGPYPFGQW